MSTLCYQGGGIIENEDGGTECAAYPYFARVSDGVDICDIHTEPVCECCICGADVPRTMSGCPFDTKRVLFDVAFNGPWVMVGRSWRAVDLSLCGLASHDCDAAAVEHRLMKCRALQCVRNMLLRVLTAHARLRLQTHG